MRTTDEIQERITEISGEIRRLENKDTLLGCASMEEYEVMDSLIAERDALNWVLGVRP